MTEDEKLIAEIRADEGVKPYAYQDHLGYWTIGIGRLIDKKKGGKLSDEEMDYLLGNDLDRFAAELDKHVPWWRKMAPVRQRVLINLCFNMGWPKLSKFKNTLAAMERGDYKAAAKGMRDSLWFKQVQPSRSGRMVKQMETGNELA